ncbi:hypothetical protein BJV74DRAFT_261305 [Russula compacta]|nr:hypothetical protein BJV74DRAFT_261305 [Russula compacta]
MNPFPPPILLFFFFFDTVYQALCYIFTANPLDKRTKGRVDETNDLDVDDDDDEQLFFTFFLFYFFLPFLLLSHLPLTKERISGVSLPLCFFFFFFFLFSPTHIYIQYGILYITKFQFFSFFTHAQHTQHNTTHPTTASPPFSSLLFSLLLTFLADHTG